MLHKKLISIALGTALTVSASAAVAGTGLTLSSTGASAPIKVVCNKINGKYDIPANGSLPTLPWGLIYAMFGFSQNLQCQFFLDNGSNTQIGSANLVLNVAAGKGEVTNVQKNPGYSVSITPGQNVFASNVSVTLHKS